MKTKHTPGPWKWVGTEKEPKSRCYLYGADDEQIGFLPDAEYLSEPDAKLIAAAPEMLEALKAFHPSLCKAPGDLARAWESAKEIITRATS